MSAVAKTDNSRSDPGLVAVTGATGHLGANLVRVLLEEGRRVRAVVRRRGPALDGLDVEIAEADVLDPSALRAGLDGVDVVHHVAGVISIDGDRDGRVQRTNVEGTRNVAQAARAGGVRRLVYFSSIHGFDIRDRSRPVDESFPPPGPDHPAYDRSKAGGEAAIRESVERGLDAVIVNPTAVIGPYDFGPSRAGKMLQDLARGKLPALVDGGFDWVDARDVAAGAIAAAAKGRRGASYILSGHLRSFTDVARAVHACGGAAPPRLRSPLWAARLAAPLATRVNRLLGRDPVFTRESLQVIESNANISHARATNELGYEPRSFETTIRDTLAWFAR